MDQAFHSAFVTAMQNVFGTMMQLPVVAGEARAVSTPDTGADVTCVVTMAGDVRGSVVLMFPRNTASRLAQLFTGEEMASDGAAVNDAIGELANMVCGGAKGLFGGKRRVTIGCPRVFSKKDYRPLDADASRVVMPFSTDCGNLLLELALEERPASVPADQRRAA